MVPEPTNFSPCWVTISASASRPNVRRRSCSRLGGPASAPLWCAASWRQDRRGGRVPRGRRGRRWRAYSRHMGYGRRWSRKRRQACWGGGPRARGSGWLVIASHSAPKGRGSAGIVRPRGAWQAGRACPGSRPRWMAAPSRLHRETPGHVPDGLDLRGVLAEVVDVAVAPPVPAAMRVHGAAGNLREQDHKPVGVGVAGKSALLDEGVADGLPRLVAAMQRDMQPAAWMTCAIIRYVDRALSGEPVGDTLVEGRLIEGDECSRQTWRGIGEGRAIDPFEDRLRLIVVAGADIRLLGKAAGSPVRLGQEGVTALLLDKRHVRLRHAGSGIEALVRLHYGAEHGLIVVAGEEIDLVIGKA